MMGNGVMRVNSPTESARSTTYATTMSLLAPVNRAASQLSDTTPSRSVARGSGGVGTGMSTTDTVPRTLRSTESGRARRTSCATYVCVDAAVTAEST